MSSYRFRNSINDKNAENPDAYNMGGNFGNNLHNGSLADIKEEA